ncbi:MAG: nuclear transport factor 2 family protein [Chitinophagaceae bacterium]|nr:nuclear transport factor 2 family protein [Chitinophagaceae bacterium]
MNNQNEQTIKRFYEAFQRLDYKTMQSCYHADAVFNDPAFGLLDAESTNAMWEMLCKRAKEFSLTFGNIQLLDDEYTTCEWNAKYLFSKTGRKINNKIKAHMRFRDGLIIEHTDAFDFYKWTRMALGLPGFLFGWSNFMQRKIQRSARAGLLAFMEKKS